MAGSWQLRYTSARLLQARAAGAILLLPATVAALAWANRSLGRSLVDFWHSRSPSASFVSTRASSDGPRDAGSKATLSELRLSKPEWIGPPTTAWEHDVLPIVRPLSGRLRQPDVSAGGHLRQAGEAAGKAPRRWED